MPTFLTLSEASRRLGKPPRWISVQLYTGNIAHDELPLVGGRRMVEASKLDELRRRFGLEEKAEAATV